MSQDISLIISRQRTHDYVTARGLTTITGHTKHDLDLCIVKELIDNALDACEEANQKNNKVSVTFHTKAEFTEITVTDNGIGLTHENIIKISDINTFSSSKTYAKNPRRGVQGNAFSVILGAPYALATETGKAVDSPPVTIKSNGSIHHLSLDVNNLTTNTSTTDTGVDMNPGTEVSVRLPLLEPYWGYRQQYTDMMQAYSLINPDTRFTLTLNHYEYADDVLEFHESGALAKQYKGKPSIHWYPLNTFKEYIGGLIHTHQEEITIDDFLHQFRGYSSPKKRREVADKTGFEPDASLLRYSSTEKITKLYNAIKTSSKRPNPKILTRIGEEQLLAQTTALFGTPQEHRYKYVYGDVGDNQVSNPFSLEVLVAAQPKSCLQKRKVLVGVNRSPCIFNPFRGTRLKVKRRRENKEYSGLDSFLNALRIKSGDPVIVVIHLCSPNISYSNYGKTEFNTKPYAEHLEGLLHQTCKFYSGFKRGSNKGSRLSKARKHLIEEIDRRVEIGKKKGSVPDGWFTTQHSIFYAVRNQMGGALDIKRKSFIDAIRVECEKKGYKRLELGIITAVRAELRFRGKVYPVRWDILETLAELGSDIIVVEKEGVSLALSPYADKKGVALLTSRGFLVEYALDLIDLMKKSGGHLYLLTDYDAAGISISQKVSQVPRLGVDLDTPWELGLSLDSVMEEYDTTKKDLAKVPEEHLHFLRSHRVEIDSVLALAGAKEFWSHLERKMLSLNPTRDLTRSLTCEVKLPEVQTIMDEISAILKENVEPEKESLEQMFVAWEGVFINVEAREKQIQDHLSDQVTLYQEYKLAIDTLEWLFVRLKKMKKTG